MVEKLKEIAKLNFDGRGESFVESSFIYPLLECLGYEQHKDYEVLVHGDDKSNFKLNYPPVERGAKKVKHYNPDYVPTIRKKSFWVIEAKSAKDVKIPFDYAYIVQGLQYCIHPEIQAEYLVITNGIDTCVYEPYRAAFLEGNFYEPTFQFNNTEILDKWDDLYNFLSNEKVREKIEQLLIGHYEKLAESSLDENYPENLWKRIGLNRLKIKNEIKKHVNTLKVEKIDESIRNYQEIIEKLPASVILDQYFDMPLGSGKSESVHYIEKALKVKECEEIFNELISQYEKSSIFRKEHIFVALSTLYHNAKSPLKEEIKIWLINNSEKELNRFNRNETILLRLIRKILVISVYPEIRNKIDESLVSAPEIIKYIDTPNSLKVTFPIELELHHKFYNKILNQTEKQLDNDYNVYHKLDAEIDVAFREAYKKLNGSEHQIGGFEQYGHGNKHYAFRNILTNLNVIDKAEQIGR